MPDKEVEKREITVKDALKGTEEFFNEIVGIVVAIIALMLIVLISLFIRYIDEQVVGPENNTPAAAIESTKSDH